MKDKDANRVIAVLQQQIAAIELENQALNGTAAPIVPPKEPSAPPSKMTEAGTSKLAELKVDREKQSRSLRVLVAGQPYILIGPPTTDLEEINDADSILWALCGQHPQLGLPTKCYSVMGLGFVSIPIEAGGHTYIGDVQFHEKMGELGTPAYRQLVRDGPERTDRYTDPTTFDNLAGGKVRVVPSSNSRGSRHVSSRQPLEGRAVPITVVKRFHEEYPGDNSRAKQHQMLADVQVNSAGITNSDLVYDDGFAYGRMKPDLPQEFVAGTQYKVWLYPHFEHDKTFPETGKHLIDGKHLTKNPKRSSEELSWVEWAAEDDAGPADLMISYSWSLNWTYLIVFMEAVFGSDVLVWIDILACGQHQIEQGAMDEISLLPEVLNYAGKTVVMPGTVSRMWCNYEFAWSIELNRKQLFYANYHSLDDKLQAQVKAHLSPALRHDVDALVSCDQQLLALPGALLLGYPDVEVDVDVVDNLDASIDGTKGAFLGKKLKNNALIAGTHKVLMYKSAKEVNVVGTALKLRGRCWKQSDEDYIQDTIQNRLGGRLQVCLAIKEAFGVKEDAAELAGGASEVEILTCLFVESNGLEWKNKENWCNDEEPTQSWFGVGMNNGHVTSLDLARNEVVVMGPTIHRLIALQTVSLQENPLDTQKIADMLRAST
jgi:hypothetical protein